MSGPPFIVENNIFSDPTGGQINQRLLMGWVQLMDHTDLTDPEKEVLFRTCRFIAVKLAAVHKHLVQYSQLEDELAEQVKGAAPAGSAVALQVEVSQDLFLEMDEFLVQLKSTLDYLVKVPVPILGRRVWNLRRFGNRGEDVAKALQGNLPQRYQADAQFLRANLIDHHKPWLTTAIDLRDEMNHYLEGSIPIERFALYKASSEDPEAVHRPMFTAQQTVREALRTLWTNLFLLVEDFVPMFLQLRKLKGMAFAKLPGIGPESWERAWAAGLDAELEAAPSKGYGPAEAVTFPVTNELAPASGGSTVSE